MAVSFSSNEHDVLTRTVDCGSALAKRTSQTDLYYVYELDTCIQWIKDSKYTQVSVQFGDSQLADSVSVVQYIQDHTEANVYILADTSYGSCCADEVGAEHISSDCLIHFGHSCGSVTSRIPVLYIHTKQYIDVCEAARAMWEYMEKYTANNEQHTHHILIEGDPVYQHALESLKAAVSERCDAEVSIGGSWLGTACGNCSCTSDSEEPGSNSRQCKSTVVVYVGSYGSQSALSYRMKYIDEDRYSHLLVYDTDTLQLVEFTRNHQLLMKRYHMIERIKDASTIGILVSTLGVTGYLAIIDHIKALIRDSGKKSYLFSVGKLNPAKLANFANIDVYVVIGCTETSLYVDSKQEYYRPLVSPYEVEMALNQGREWRAAYTLEFNELLPGGRHHVPRSGVGGGECVDVSLVTGQVRQLGVPPSDTTGSRAHRQLVLADDDDARSSGWRGLEVRYGEGDVHVAAEGHTGTPGSYQHEPHTPTHHTHIQRQQ